jgi:hypothetical protein
MKKEDEKKNTYIRRKKREWLKQELQEAEKLNMLHESRKFYKKINNQRKEFNP